MSRIENALDSWREWGASLDTRPVVIAPLGGGRSNRSYLLESGSEQMVLRINAPATALPNPDRGVEARVWRAASEEGIAPRLLYADPGGAFLVSAYIENGLPDRPQDNQGLTEQALELLQRCHRLNVDAPVIDYAAHIDRYWQIIQDRGASVDPSLREQRGPMHRILKDITRSSTPADLCHHDLVMENFVGSQKRLYLIDWEYAARGLRVMDYAAFAVEWGIEAALVCERTGTEPELLSMAMDFYRYQCHLWEAITQASLCS